MLAKLPNKKNWYLDKYLFNFLRACYEHFIIKLFKYNHNVATITKSIPSARWMQRLPGTFQH